MTEIKVTTDIELTEMKSSNIQACGYCTETKTMAVEFKGGGTYLFPGVKPAHYLAFLGSESPGKHFHDNIRGRYESLKVESEDE